MAASEDVRKAVESAIGETLDRVKSELTRSVADAIPDVAAEPAAAPAAPGAGAGLTELRGKLFDLFDGSGQVEVLNRLMAEIGRYWNRSVLYLVKGPEFRPWDARGFEASGGNDAVKGAPIDASADTVLAAALAGRENPGDDAKLDARMGAAEGPRAAVPLGIRGKAAAVLYCDGPRGSEDEAVAAMEILARVTAASIELSMLTDPNAPTVRSAAVRSGARTVTGTAVDAEPVEDAAFAEPASEAPSEPPSASPAEPPPGMDSGATFQMPAMQPEAEPPAAEAAPASDTDQAEAGATVQFAAPSFDEPAAAAPEPEPEPAEPEPAEPEPAEPEPSAPEPAAAEPKPAAPAASPPADLLKGGAKPLVGAGEAGGEAPKKFSRWTPIRDQMKGSAAVDPALEAVPEAERPKHVEAKKIARLLISEIKLYNEAKVAVGRKNGDLYERLKEDIERSRKTYFDRVDSDVAAKTDYFRDELVATLAEGDAAALGMDD